VLAANDADDPTAHDILAQAGAELAALAKIVLARLFDARASAPVAMSGGVFRNCAFIRQVFYNNLRLDYAKVVVNPAVVDPVKGALEIARRGGKVG
jgi:N-acetylglucosamine kinase-like BadF-type ATPase